MFLFSSTRRWSLVVYPTEVIKTWMPCSHFGFLLSGLTYVGGLTGGEAWEKCVHHLLYFEPFDAKISFNPWEYSLHRCYRYLVDIRMPLFGGQ